jgi:serine/threonine protein kinase
MAAMAETTDDLVAGRYRLAELVGQGGMGRVWRGHDQLLDREVAVKEVVLPDNLTAGQRDDLVERAMREARAAARLNHPGIITVHDVVLHDGKPWIVMEFVSGQSLAQTITRSGKLDWGRVAAIGAVMADALAHAHAAGIVHRDLKPDNVLLAGQRVVITDFGIARILDAASRLTSSAVLVGTPQYMPPEQLNGEQVQAPGDLWALGATLYAAVEGRPPFDGPTLSAIWAAILTRPLSPPEHAGRLASILNDLMSKVPEQRPDARTTAAHLTALQHSDSPGIRAGVSRPPSFPTRETDGSQWLPTQTSMSESEKLALPVPDQPVSGRLSRTLEGHHGLTLAMAFSPDGRLLATCDPHSDFRIWDIATGRSLHQLRIGGSAIAFRPDGRLVAAGTYQAVHLLDPATGRQLRNIPIPSTDHHNENVSLSFTPDGRRLALFRPDDQKIWLWDSTTGEGNGEVKLKAWGAEILWRAKEKNAHYVKSAFSPYMDALATSDNRTVQLWDPLSGKRFRSIGGSGSAAHWPAHSIVFSGDGRALATRSTDDTIKLWDCSTGKNTLTFEGPLHGSAAHSFAGRALAFGLNDRLLAVAVIRGVTQIRDASTGQILSLIGSPDQEAPDISCLAFSPDGRLLVIGETYPTTSKKFPRTKPIHFPAQVQIWELT